MSDPKFELFRIAQTQFEAARQLDKLPDTHPEHRLHGHTFRLRVESPELCSLDQLKQVLDYRSLNDLLEDPDDFKLVQWMAREAPHHFYLSSGSEQGTELSPHGLLAWCHFRFEAAHRLPNVPAGHQCGRMHGHGFEVRIFTRAADGSAVLTRAKIKEAWQPLFAQLDHRCLNEIEGLENPTSEMLANWLWEKLTTSLPELLRITVQETHTAGCSYNGREFRIWKDQRFESAVQLCQAPADHPLQRLHGHSYLLRLELTAPLDEVYGWTVDFGDVKTLFKPIYKQLDHHQLNELEGVENGDLESLLHWIYQQAAPELKELSSIEIMQNPSEGARLSWQHSE